MFLHRSSNYLPKYLAALCLTGTTLLFPLMGAAQQPGGVPPFAVGVVRGGSRLAPQLRRGEVDQVLHPLRCCAIVHSPSLQAGRAAARSRPQPRAGEQPTPSRGGEEGVEAAAAGVGAQQAGGGGAHPGVAMQVEREQCRAPQLARCVGRVGLRSGRLVREEELAQARAAPLERGGLGGLGVGDCGMAVWNEDLRRRAAGEAGGWVLETAGG